MIFENKIALVTGATSGIGKEIAKQLLLEGAIIFANYGHDEEKMIQAKKELEELGNIEFIKADISNEVEVDNMFQKIKEKYGKLDYLVNNAGTNVDDFIESFNMKEWKKVIDVNLVGKVMCTKYAISLLKKSKCASVVNIASRLGTKPCEGASAYCTAEAGIIMFTKASALELSKYNIRVNSVSPSLTITPLSLSGWTEEEIKETKENNPLKRLGETTDISNTVLFLLSNESDFITSENINVNGGSLL